MARDPELLTHIEWLGYLQPVGLVVSPPALVDAQAFPSKNIIPEHNRFLEMVDQITLEGENDPQPSIRDFPRFATQMLGWEPADLVGTAEGGPVPDSLEVTLTEYNETLRPSYAVPEFDKAPNGDRKWLMLIQRVKLGLDLDDTPETDAKDHRWQASPQARFERLLRETQVPIGLLSNGTHLRLVYAPRGETSGHLTFPVQAMTEVAGRPIFAALQMLLNANGFSICRTSSACRPSWPTAGSTRTSSRPSWPSRSWPPFTSCSAGSRRPTTSDTASCSATC